MYIFVSFLLYIYQFIARKNWLNIGCNFSNQSFTHNWGSHSVNLDLDCITVLQKWMLRLSMSREKFKWSFSGVIKSSSFSALDQQGCPAEFKWPERKSEQRISMCVCVITHMGIFTTARGNDLRITVLCESLSYSYRVNHCDIAFILCYSIKYIVAT